MKKMKTKFESEKELLEEIFVFNYYVEELNFIEKYKELQIQEGTNTEESQNKFYDKYAEITHFLDIHQSNLFMKYKIKIPDECKIYGILPTLYMKHEIEYLIENKKTRYYKARENIQERIKI